MQNNLPQGWVLAKIEEVAFTASGGTPSTSKKEYWENGNIPWMNSGTLKDNTITKPSHYITELGLKNSSAKLFPKDSVVIALTGATTGRVGILDFDCSANQSVTALYPSEFNCPKFLFYFLLASRDEIVGMSLGSAQPHINKNIVDNLQIPIPPLAEQQRIVAKLGEVFKKIESNKQRFEKIPKLLKRFRQSVLAAAINGKLTAEWRKEASEKQSLSLIQLNSEREQLQRENAKKRGQKSFTYKQPVSIEIGERTKGIDELFEIPDNWHWVSLDQCVWSVSDGPHFSPNYVSQKEGLPFISSRNVSYSRIDFNDAKYVSKEDYTEFIKRGKPEANDVLLTKGGTTGIAHKITTEVDFSIWVHVALLKVIKKYIDPTYLTNTLTSDFLYRQSQAQTHGVGNQDLGLTRMIYMAIPLPPLEEQKEISRRVEELFAFADKIEARYTKAKAMLDKLPQSILAKAIRGELVPQDPNDEPASVLLERIKAEKTNKKEPQTPKVYKQTSIF